MSDSYVHGYDPREHERLHDQAGTLVDLLHSGTSFPSGSRVLEAGCGVGAQTVTLVRNSAGAHFVAIDISADSIAQARSAIAAGGLANVDFVQADIFAAPFRELGAIRQPNGITVMIYGIYDNLTVVSRGAVGARLSPCIPG